MREYILGVFILAFIIGVCRMISYKNDESTHARFAFSILVIYTVTAPFLYGEIELSDINLGGIDVDISDYDESYIEVAREAYERGVRDMICSEFSLGQGDVRVVSYGFDFATVSASRITVYLSGGAAISDNKKIKKYICESGFSECDVKIELG